MNEPEIDALMQGQEDENGNIHYERMYSKNNLSFFVFNLAYWTLELFQSILHNGARRYSLLFTFWHCATNLADIIISPIITIFIFRNHLRPCMASQCGWSFLMHLLCFSPYSFREPHHVCVRGHLLWEWWGKLNYICRPHGVGTSILLWRPINKKDFGLSLLNHSVFPCPRFIFLPSLFLEVTSSCSRSSAFLVHPGWLSTVGWRPGKKEMATHEVRVCFFFRHPSRVTITPPAMC